MQGWIGLHRKLMENPVWVDPNYLKLWIYCLFKASHKPHKHLVGNQLIELERGQFITGRDALAEDMNKGLKPKQKLDGLTWFRYLKNMEKWEMLNIKTNNKFSVVTVVKYEVYQHNEVEVEQQVEQQLNNKRTTNEQQMNTNNNVNKGNNDKKIKKPSIPKFEICDMENAKYLFSLIQQNNETAKQPNFDKWAEEFRKIRTIDKREYIEYMIKWSQQDPFWCTNILSPATLRKQWDKLYMKAKKQHEQANLKIGSHTKQNDIDWGNI